MRVDLIPELYATEPGEAQRLLREVLAGQAALLAEVRALRRVVEQRAAPVDPEGQELVRAIHDYVGTDVAFGAAELIGHADAELRDALAGLDAHALGRRLAQLADREAGGWCVRRVARDANGIVWAITAG